jgi:hypothetical protein
VSSGFLKRVRNILLVVIVLLIFDIVVMSFGASYLTVVFFDRLVRGKSHTTVLSNLLFLEAVVFLGVGAFFVGGLGEAAGGPRGTYRGGITPEPAQRRGYREKQTASGALLMIIGAILMGLSIAIALL